MRVLRSLITLLCHPNARRLFPKFEEVPTEQPQLQVRD